MCLRNCTRIGHYSQDIICYKILSKVDMECGNLFSPIYPYDGNKLHLPPPINKDSIWREGKTNKIARRHKLITYPDFMPRIGDGVFHAFANLSDAREEARAMLKDGYYFGHNFAHNPRLVIAQCLIPRGSHPTYKGDYETYKAYVTTKLRILKIQEDVPQYD